MPTSSLKGKILITGATGYIGSVLTPYLRQAGFQTLGVDSGFFADCTIDEPCDGNSRKLDVRSLEDGLLRNTAAVVHLAGISNDPFGDLSPSRIYDPTRAYTLDLALRCKKRGIRFIFASSCSIYGKGADKPLDETSPVAPQTPYSANKLQIEKGLQDISGEGFTPICLRFATAFGYSPRIRFDVFINMMVGMALTQNKIILNSDGQAWRPSLHVDDICKSILFAVRDPGGDNRAVILNVGTDSENHRIIDIARMIRDKRPGCELKFMRELNRNGRQDDLALVRDRKIQDHVDSRTYKISFRRIRERYPGFGCDWDVSRGIDDLIRHLKRLGLTEELFQSRRFYRLQRIDDLFRCGRLDGDLMWRT